MNEAMRSIEFFISQGWHVFHTLVKTSNSSNYQTTSEILLTGLSLNHF
jgi:hypothetical protein